MAPQHLLDMWLWGLDVERDTLSAIQHFSQVGTGNGDDKKRVAAS